MLPVPPSQPSWLTLAGVESLVIKASFPSIRTGDAMNQVDSAQITSIISAESLCGACIARKADVPRQRVDRALDLIRGAAKFTTELARCDSCLKWAVVHRLG